MNIEKINIGQKYVYYPPHQNAGDNLHFPAVVEAKEKLVKVRIFMSGAPEGVLRNVSAKRLYDQRELL